MQAQYLIKVIWNEREREPSPLCLVGGLCLGPEAGNQQLELLTQWQRVGWVVEVGPCQLYQFINSAICIRNVCD